MKLDATDLRYVTSEEFRVLTAVEMGSKNHEVVPVVLIVQISGIRGGGVNKLIGSLAKRNLVAKVQNSKYDGYRLTYGGYDYLAMRALSKRDSMYSVGNQIGVGKESDIYVVSDSESNNMVLKLHRLGRVSFRAVTEKRDYLAKRKSASWMYMSRLAAQKEWAFMKVLHEHGFPVPRPIDHSRHCILMEFIDAHPLRQVAEVPSPGQLYSTLMDLIVRFARAGLIHGDFNEFNILVRREDGKPIVIDFPQMISTSHENAEWYFNRDVDCIRTFFRRRFRYESSVYPRFQSVPSDAEGKEFKLDVVASGSQARSFTILEKYMDAVKSEEPNASGSEEESEGDTSDEDEDEEQTTLEQAGNNPSTSNIVTMPSNREILQEHDDISDHQPPGSPPANQSRHSHSPSTSSLDKRMPSLSLRPNVKETVSSDLSKILARKERKYHSKRGVRRAGRPQGSKAKQDTKIKLDKSGIWE